MPSMEHESLLLLFRNRPTMAAELLRDALGVPVPEFTEARLEPSDLTEVVPRERRADQLLLFVGNAPLLGIVLEAQLAPDEDKRYSWPGYLVGMRSRYRCPVSVLVITTDPSVAAWCAKPIELGLCGSTVKPFVLGPSAVPVVTDVAAAREKPELAVLSAMAHGRSDVDVAVPVAVTALAAAAGLDQERATLYGDVVLSCLGEAARRALEAMMANGNYEYQSEFVRKNVAKGQAEGALKTQAAAVLTVLEARGLAISDEVRQRVLASTDLDQLSHWLRRAAVVSSAVDIFETAS